MEDIFFGPTFQLASHYPSSQWEYDREIQVFSVNAKYEKPHFLSVKELAPIMLEVMLEQTPGPAGIKVETEMGELSLMVDGRRIIWKGYKTSGNADLGKADFPVYLRAIAKKEGASLWFAPVYQSFRAVLVDDHSLVGAKMGLYVSDRGSYVFENARVTKLGKGDLDHGEFGRVSSRLETLNISTLRREIVYETNHHFEAPNWHSDKGLIFNQGGRLMQFSLKDYSIDQIAIDQLKNLNNDHGIHPEGSHLVVSNNDPGSGSRIYTIPINGGEPILITKEGPSYWHGWSPDGNWLAFTGKRKGDKNFNIYRINRESGLEESLTQNVFLDDGPDYAPDGKSIYFNSNRTGTMQIWKMDADGSHLEQITFDTFQDWFPHPSPDGRWLMFISYLPEIASAEHLPGRMVMLRILDLLHPGTSPRVLTHVYGGQGTINVPSWSPDSKQVAFVSYTF